MFGLLISSRPLLFPPQKISETQYVFPDIPTSPHFSHLGVFLLPFGNGGQQAQAPFPPDHGAAVYVQLPGQQGFVLLGGIGVGKESAIFRINLPSSTSATGAGGMEGDAMSDDTTLTNGTAATTGATGTLTVGISIEPASTLGPKLAALKPQSHTATNSRTTASASQPSTVVLAQRIIKNAYNFLASYSGHLGPGGEEVVPLKAFQAWWSKFEGKVRNDPGFLEREPE